LTFPGDFLNWECWLIGGKERFWTKWMGKQEYPPLVTWL